MSVVVITRGHVTDVLKRPLSHTDALLITGVLYRAGIPVDVYVESDGLAHLWAMRALDTREQVQVYRAVKAVSDSGLVWGGRRSV